MHACVPPRARRARGPVYHRNDALVPRTSADCEARDTVRCEEREPTRRRRLVGSIVAAVRAGQRVGVPLASGRSSDTRFVKAGQGKARHHGETDTNVSRSSVPRLCTSMSSKASPRKHSSSPRRPVLHPAQSRKGGGGLTGTSGASPDSLPRSVDCRSDGAVPYRADASMSGGRTRRVRARARKMLREGKATATAKGKEGWVGGQGSRVHDASD